MPTKTITFSDDAHRAASKIAAAHGMKLYAVVSNAVLAVHAMSAADQSAFLRRDTTSPPLPASDRTIPLNRICNLLQKDAVAFDELIDDAMSDDKIDPGERERIRAFIKQMFERLCQAAAHVAEPMGVH